MHGFVALATRIKWKFCSRYFKRTTGTEAFPTERKFNSENNVVSVCSDIFFDKEIKNRIRCWRIAYNVLKSIFCSLHNHSVFHFPLFAMLQLVRVCVIKQSTFLSNDADAENKNNAHHTLSLFSVFRSSARLMCKQCSFLFSLSLSVDLNLDLYCWILMRRTCCHTMNA